MYNIYKISTSTFKAVELLHAGVEMEKVDELEYREQKKFNVADFYVAGYEVGSTADIKSNEELNYV